MNQFRRRGVLGAAMAVCALAAFQPAASWAWEPSKPVQFIVPAGTGGGADQMARFIQGTVSKHKLMKEPIIVVNESGGAGAQGFLDVKDSKGDSEKIVITSDSVILDSPIRWVNAASHLIRVQTPQAWIADL